VAVTGQNGFLQGNVTGELMKKNKHSAIPDFSRAKPVPGAKAAPTTDKAPVPHPRQTVQPPTKARTGGRRGS